MKGYPVLLLFLALASSAYGEQAGSSYAVLPYENEIPYNPSGGDYNKDYYQYDNNDGNKKDFSLKKLMKMPLNAMKNAGSYMKSKFDNLKNKFLELNGSIIRAKGTFLQGKGQNMVRAAYSSAAQGNVLPGFDYYPSSNGYSQSQSYSAPNHQAPYPEVSNAIDDSHPVSSQGYHQQHLGPTIPADSQSSYSSASSQRVGLVIDQAASASEVGSSRADRSYSAGPAIDYGPIPVPVPMKIFPSRLVMPQLDFLNGGYH